MTKLIPVEVLEKKIYLIRAEKVMLSTDLAELYGVQPRVLIPAVKRNIKLFPEKGRGQHPKYLPYAFTEQGVAMLSSVLNSERAVQVNIAIMRAFVKLREVLSTHKELAYKLAELERKIAKHDEHI